MPDEWAWFALGCALILAFGYAVVSVLYRGLNSRHKCRQQMTTEPVYLLAALALLESGASVEDVSQRLRAGIEAYEIIEDPGFEYKTGDSVRKTGGDYSFNGWVVTAFRKRGPTGKQDGPVRYVIEDGRGLLMIMNGPQLSTGARGE